ncbi:hypothetical protein [Thermofilum pendens]|uniref:Uncharacterized protein n=1 Tax=Thermofilum pendens (strain DSM 2475 / Hrk 5) TaxID=368408 RepID=A1S1E1_THEPD|nr:hypothetical protein [Thermofilum pendens]ABL79271.1 hypothetical protein Tpen_1876 [Thermofilum pendens Hrk 5]
MVYEKFADKIKDASRAVLKHTFLDMLVHTIREVNDVNVPVLIDEIEELQKKAEEEGLQAWVDFLGALKALVCAYGFKNTILVRASYMEQYYRMIRALETDGFESEYCEFLTWLGTSFEHTFPPIEKIARERGILR